MAWSPLSCVGALGMVWCTESYTDGWLTNRRPCWHVTPHHVTRHRILWEGLGVAEDVTSLYCGIKPFCSMEKSRPFTWTWLKDTTRCRRKLDSEFFTSGIHLPQLFSMSLLVTLTLSVVLSNKNTQMKLHGCDHDGEGLFPCRSIDFFLWVSLDWPWPATNVKGMILKKTQNIISQKHFKGFKFSVKDYLRYVFTRTRIYNFKGFFCWLWEHKPLYIPLRLQIKIKIII